MILSLSFIMLSLSVTCFVSGSSFDNTLFYKSELFYDTLIETGAARSTLFLVVVGSTDGIFLL